MNLLPKSLVGTASFGSQYGLANDYVMRTEEVNEVIEVAQGWGLSGFETAQDYFGSEESLQGVKGSEIFTKLSKNANCTSKESLITQAKISLDRLDKDSVDGFSFHSSKQLLEKPLQSQEAMEELKNQGLARSWGVSIYDPEELDRVLDISNPDFIQAPVSAVNQAFLKPRILDRLQSQSVELHARSVFLQGALLMNPASLPRNLEGLKPTIKRLELAASDTSVGIRDFLIGFVGSFSAISRIVVGVNSPRQLNEYVESCERLSALQGREFSFSNPNLDPGLTDPRLWGLR